MPELPEVETTLRGIAPVAEGQWLQDLHIRHTKLRWEIDSNLPTIFANQYIERITRRGKYLLFHTQRGTALIHLGMSGSLRIVPKDTPPDKHDHFDLVFSDFCLRYTDPRRFGALLWTQSPPEEHPLLRHLGPEPLTRAFSRAYLYDQSRNKKVSIKQFIMNSHTVVGVGNIYAAESLFLAQIHPLTPAKILSAAQCESLVRTIKAVLRAAIEQGGTTLRNFLSSEGRPGYFKQKLNVYGRENYPCPLCQTKLESLRIQNRATVFCPRCQALPE